MRLFRGRVLLCVLFPCVLVFALAARATGSPVEFRFEAANGGTANPFARQVWGDVSTPDGRTLTLPAFFDGAHAFVVRARADAPGTYRLTGAHETIGNDTHSVGYHATSAATVTVAAPETLPSVQRDPAAVDRVELANGRSIIPVGANVAWAEGPVLPFYEHALAEFGAQGLNWMRVWMAHWGRLNLDWRPGEGGSPAPGTLDGDVAKVWDQLLQTAEDRGVYIQFVLQHHGQYSSKVNSNWNENPWNAANPGGFLQKPEDFFTSERARQLTKQKYRYIVARWGWSPAIFAWELFNEVHWVDAMQTPAGEAKVGAWHTEMAQWIRSLDVYHHLVTSSTENLASPVYAAMDYYQPHLYAAELILGARRIPTVGGIADRPVFYGEQGDDHLDVPTDVKHSGRAIVPPMWAGLFGEAGMPAQAWLGADLLRQGRVAELGALAHFIAGSGFAEQRALRPFSAAVDSAAHIPFVISGCQVWQRRLAPDFVVPTDGSLPLGLGDVPRYLSAVNDGGFPSEETFQIDLPRATHATARVVGAAGPAGIEITVDGASAANASWKSGDALPSAEHPVVVRFAIPAGRHTVVVRHAVGAWVELAGLDLGLDAPALGVMGQRNATYVALWVWNRADVYAPSPKPVSGTIEVRDVAAGKWRVTWWDTEKGVAQAPSTISHPGGVLRLPTPPIARHAAVVLSREL